jgi:hypothetical protein
MAVDIQRLESFLIFVFLCMTYAWTYFVLVLSDLRSSLLGLDDLEIVYYGA